MWTGRTSRSPCVGLSAEAKTHTFSHCCITSCSAQKKRHRSGGNCMMQQQFVFCAVSRKHGVIHGNTAQVFVSPCCPVKAFQRDVQAEFQVPTFKRSTASSWCYLCTGRKDFSNMNHMSMFINKLQGLLKSICVSLDIFESWFQSIYFCFWYFPCENNQLCIDIWFAFYNNK